MCLSLPPHRSCPSCRGNANLQNQAQGPRQDARHDRHTTSPHLPADRVKMAEPWNPGHEPQALGSVALPAGSSPTRALRYRRPPPICAICARRPYHSVQHACCILQLCLCRHHPSTLPGRSTSPLHLVSCASADSSACPAQPAVKISARSRFPASSVPSAAWCPEPTLWCASWGLTADKVLSATVPGQSARPDDLPYDQQTDKHRSCQLTTRETRPRPSSASSAAPWLGFRPV